VYDNPGRVALLALHTFCRMCKLQVLKAVEKFDSHRLHHPHISREKMLQLVESVRVIQVQKAYFWGHILSHHKKADFELFAEDRVEPWSKSRLDLKAFFG
jgi:hypothetical protein